MNNISKLPLCESCQSDACEDLKMQDGIGYCGSEYAEHYPRKKKGIPEFTLGFWNVEDKTPPEDGSWILAKWSGGGYRRIRFEKEILRVWRDVDNKVVSSLFTHFAFLED